MNSIMPGIETATNRYAEDREELARLVRALNNEMEALKNRCLPRIKKAVADCAARHDRLAGLINSAPELFNDPRTVTFHGIKIGFRKGVGKVDWEDDAKLVAAIEKMFTADERAKLIKTTKKPISKAVQNLKAETLQKLGCTIEATGDVLVIAPVDGEVEKIVSALLKNATEES
jgi:hypothetical protein